MITRLRPLRAVLLMTLVALPASAGDLMPKAQLPPLTSAEGMARFDRIQQQTDYALLGGMIETQATETFSGVATAVAVLNALLVPRPVDMRYEPYPYFTQRTFFTKAMAPGVSRGEVLKKGMTLEQLAAALRRHETDVAVVFAGAASANDFRETVVDAVDDEEIMIAVNYRRDAINQEGGSHFSPIGGYDGKTDSVLILDVARYRYPPVWVTIDDLMTAMRKADGNSGKTHGWLVIEPS